MSRRPAHGPGSGRTAEERDGQGSPRVVVADDHPFFRSSLAKVLRQNGMDVLSEVGSGEAAIAAVSDLAPDVVVMDLKMPGVSGLEATRRLTAAYPATHVVVLSVSAREDDVIDTVLAGASGYVLKEAPLDELIGDIRAAAAGEPLVSGRIASALLRRVRAAIVSGEGLAGVGISARELEILDAFAGGGHLAEVAKEVGLSESDVREYTTSLLSKLRVDSAVRTALRKLA